MRESFVFTSEELMLMVLQHLRDKGKLRKDSGYSCDSIARRSGAGRGYEITFEFEEKNAKA